MPCYVCNPSCGKCNPPRPRPVKCAHCELLSTYEENEFGAAYCTHCGAELAELEKVPCLFTGKLCKVTCFRSTTPSPSGKTEECPWGNALDE